MARRKSRIIAFQALYSWDVNNIPLEELLEFAWVDEQTQAKLGDDNLSFSRMLISGTIENIEKVDETIKSHLTNWDFSRLNKVDLAVLRISVYPLIFQQDMPSTIIIDEAVDISKEYGSDDSFKFINAILDSIKKSCRTA
ncbi:MAG: transcription antitermination factor NusB [Spirochaetaceae bacterium]|nr:transcription antitermination factor NusB [Spirochaetaceae bacterium]MBO4728114.1 transcription antitermination factor NusB [Spirochaetaceae bacterium]MBR4825651.1 transcription antitermination factor NusB [Spirochaetaceae bacterium]